MEIDGCKEVTIHLKNGLIGYQVKEKCQKQVSKNYTLVQWKHQNRCLI